MNIETKYDLELVEQQASSSPTPSKIYKYHRRENDDVAIKYISILPIFLIIIVFYYFSNNMMYNDIENTQPLYILNNIYVILFFVLHFFWFYYKLHYILLSMYKICMSLETLRKNSKYYSGLEIPDELVQRKLKLKFQFQSGPIDFPDITILIPIYTENLENTIIPTIQSAIIESKRYSKETGRICNIIVCDDGMNITENETNKTEKEKRIRFYQDNNIGYTCRPHPSKYPRAGRFKKASNINFSIHYSKIKDAIITNTLALNQYTSILEKGAIFGGNIHYNPFIFLIDSDTRFPDLSNDNDIGGSGCLKIVMKDFLYDGENVLYLQCFSGPFLSMKSLPEKCIYHFTSHIFNGIMIATSLNLLSPLVGHNVCLDLCKLEEISTSVSTTDAEIKQYFSEDKISEDFDCMIRGFNTGYIGRYITSAGVFLEGVSFNFITEYFKISKFACGAAELTFNPMNRWIGKWSEGCGVFSQDLVRFIMCENIEWYNKLYILSYILNFMAIAQSHLSLFYNLFFFETIKQIVPLVFIPVNLMWELLFVWGVFLTFLNIVFSKKVGFNTNIFMRQQFREIFFTFCIFGSLSVRFSIMYFIHLFNLRINFGATQKNKEVMTIYDWVYSTRYECGIYLFYSICIFLRVFMFYEKTMLYTFYYGCLLVVLFVVIYWFVWHNLFKGCTE